ncbi:hypothetical protein F5Y13DRAFT_200698 [Hypoxylon sp. FL1857]|nr:hypothetical protein F5Y13DRAFT_200698 [Hypoxylon sp. FL1857]
MEIPRGYGQWWLIDEGESSIDDATLGSPTISSADFPPHSPSQEDLDESDISDQSSQQSSESTSYTVESSHQSDNENNDNITLGHTSDEYVDSSEEEPKSKEESSDSEEEGSSDSEDRSASDEPSPGGKAEQPYSGYVSKLFGVFSLQLTSAITISDDLSHTTKVEERQLLALRDRNTKPQPPPTSPSRIPKNQALEEYQMRMQLMLLEKQNKWRLMMARWEQEMATAGSSAGAPVTAMPVDGPHATQKRSHLESESDHIDLDKDVLDLGVTELESYIERLQKRARQLGASGSKSEQTYRYQVLYRILEDKWVQNSPKEDGKWQEVLSPPYFDPPEWMSGQNRKGTLRCQLPVQNFALYLEQRKDISFIVYRTYVAPGTILHKHKPGSDPRTTSGLTVNESIRPIHEDLIDAIHAILESKEEYAEIKQEFKRNFELHAPYLFVFHQRDEWNLIQNSLSEASRKYMIMFWDYIIQQYGDEYAAADACISTGTITSKNVNYLFKPGEILVQRTGDKYLGWVARSWARFGRSFETTRRKAAEHTKNRFAIPLYGSKSASQHTSNQKVIVQDWTIAAWHWEFDGNFQRRDSVLSFSIQVVPDTKEITSSRAKETTTTGEIALDQDSTPIPELGVFPIRHASREIVDQLRRRGQTFWRCRNRGFVSYPEGTNDSKDNLTDERYVIDLKTYRSLHKDNQYENRAYRMGLVDELGEEVMSKDEPPDDQFALLLPPTIKGFNLRRKKWYDLVAEQVKEVNWNKEAFQKVVIDRKAKDLIRALVSNLIATEKNTDLIEGKGNGLILLLHGSPGTGKTLTAESVAEIAEKPLYRVTCGDIGTKAEDVEKYLESVFYLGKLWGCVVLLDEADVFLEQRSLEDLERNALVSVFLRVLEYYEGILILTSNRVGIFDEAFKSRIQLALHYPTLGPYQRLRIWENFLDRLDKIDDNSVDLNDLRDHLDDLKEEEMNGRQIRNTITTARQYAKWKNTTLTYAHLKDVIEVSGRFDKYLNKLHGGLSSDELAEDDGLRLA